MAFLLTIFVPAAYVARHAGKRPHRGPAMSAEEAAFFRYVRKHWSEEAVLPKAVGLGLATGIVAATSSYVARLMKRSLAGRGQTSHPSGLDR